MQLIEHATLQSLISCTSELLTATLLHLWHSFTFTGGLTVLLSFKVLIHFHWWTVVSLYFHLKPMSLSALFHFHFFIRFTFTLFANMYLAPMLARRFPGDILHKCTSKNSLTMPALFTQSPAGSYQQVPANDFVLVFWGSRRRAYHTGCDQQTASLAGLTITGLELSDWLV